SDCNYAAGRWVFDDSRPLYSGFGCKKWLSPMWACRLMQRMDFEYEKLRWVPKDCEMEGFSSSKFLNRMQSKTLAFVGDSLGRQQFQSLMCMLTGGETNDDVIDVGYEYGLVKARGAIRPDGWAYKFPDTNTTILYYWSASLCDLEPLDASDPSAGFAMHLDRPPAFLRRYLPGFDFLVLNTGHHWNKGKLVANRWIMHLGGTLCLSRNLIRFYGSAKDVTLRSIVRWLESQLPSHPNLRAFYRTMSPRHFSNGDWNTGGTCDGTRPRNGSAVVARGVGEEGYGEDDAVGRSAVEGSGGGGVRLLDITGLSGVRDEGHISKYGVKGAAGVEDCLHWCLPGVPDTWNEVLFALII
ncbi:hypothetical protein M569_13061, partial [Genlisea aurea]